MNEDVAREVELFLGVWLLDLGSFGMGRGLRTVGVRSGRGSDSPIGAGLAGWMDAFCGFGASRVENACRKSGRRNRSLSKA